VLNNPVLPPSTPSSRLKNPVETPLPGAAAAAAALGALAVLELLPTARLLALFLDARLAQVRVCVRVCVCVCVCGGH
jgi:hypothetical protein